MLPAKVTAQLPKLTRVLTLSYCEALLISMVRSAPAAAAGAATEVHLLPRLLPQLRLRVRTHAHTALPRHIGSNSSRRCIKLLPAELLDAAAALQWVEWTGLPEPLLASLLLVLLQAGVHCRRPEIRLGAQLVCLLDARRTRTAVRQWQRCRKVPLAPCWPAYLTSLIACGLNTAPLWKLRNQQAQRALEAAFLQLTERQLAALRQS